MIALLHIEPDAQTAEFIRHTLQQGDYLVTSVQSGKEGLIAAWRDQPQIILCELELPDIDGFEFLEKLRKDHRTQRTPIIALTNSSDPSSAIKAKEAGVDRYFVKQPGAVDMLIDFLAKRDQSLPDRPAHQAATAPGRITTVMGIKGGVGTSSIALNTGHLLGLKLGEGRVLVMDFDLPIGSVATISGSKNKLSLDQLLEQEPQALVNMSIHEELQIPKAWSCAVLPGFKHPLPPEDWNAGNIPALLQFLRNLYEHVVIDLGRDLSPTGQSVLAQSDHIFLILQPDEECVGRAKSIFSYLRKLGIDRNKISFITNRPLPTESLTTKSTEEALGHALLGAIPNTGDEVSLVNSLHAPIALRFPESRGNLVIQMIADSLVEEDVKQLSEEGANVRT